MFRAVLLAALAISGLACDDAITLIEEAEGLEYVASAHPREHLVAEGRGCVPAPCGTIA